jgi:hypothetical protein
VDFFCTGNDFYPNGQANQSFTSVETEQSNVEEMLLKKIMEPLGKIPPSI